MKIKAITITIPDNPIQSPEKVRNNIGINCRYVAGSLTSFDLQYYAALDLFKLLNLDPVEVDCIVSVTQTPVFKAPINACILQDKLKCRTNIMAFDSPLGCSGYTYALGVIQGLLKSGMIKNCLLLCGDTQTKLIDPEDSATSELFSDAGSASWILPSEEEVAFDFGTDGKGYSSIIVRDDFMEMNGVSVFKFTTGTIPNSIRKARPELDFDYLVLHQANQMINSTIIKRLGVSPDKALNSLRDFGNTSINTIPVTLAACFKNGNIKGNLLLSGFGVGLSWCSVYLPNQEIIFGEINYLSQENRIGL